MGLIRKMTSMSTMGLVDFRSDKERIAKNTKQGYKAQRDGNVIAAQQLAAQQALLQAQFMAQQAQMQQYQAFVVAPPPPQAPLPPPLPLALPQASLFAEGWHPDPLGIASERRHDGNNWTNEVR